jgi:hypothetical protein
VTIDDKQVRGPFLHGPDDDDSSAVTFWGKQQLCRFLPRTILILDLQTQAQ